jgi:hypothetical protein
MKESAPPYLKTLVDCHKKMMEDGFTEDFKVEGGKLKCFSNSRMYDATEVSIVNFFRFEGQSDPDDNSIMYVIETIDEKKGTLVDAYGTYADANINNFITAVEDIKKKDHQVK